MSNSEPARLTWKQFAVATVVLLGLVFLFDRGFFRLFRAVEKKSFSLSLLEDRLRAIPDKSRYEVLALGSSRVYNAIIPKFINPEIGGKLFREGSKGKGPRYSYHFYRMYREAVGIPKVVVYGIDYFLFGLGSLAPLMQGFPECRDVPESWTNGISLLLSNKDRIDQYFNSLLVRFQEKSRLGPHRIEPENNVADMENFAGEAVFDPSRVVTEMPPDFEARRSSYSPYPGEEGAYFLDLLRELKKDRVTILLATIPDHIGTFRTYRSYDAFLKDVEALIGDLDYDGRCLFIDYDSPELFPMQDRDCFINGGYGTANSHLSAKGAEIYSRMLARDLKKILEAGKRP